MGSLIEDNSESISLKRRLATNETENVLFKKISQLFYLCDIDNKGYASRDDLYRLKEELGLNRDEIDNAFDQLDTDKDNQLTPEEFTTGFGLFLGIEHSKSSKAVFANADFAFQVFTLIDKHDNGYITKTDLLESADALEIEISNVDSIFHNLKTNNSQHIYFEDFAKHISTIVSQSPPLREIKRIEEEKIRKIKKKNIVARVFHMDLSAFTDDDDVEKVLHEQATILFHQCDVEKKNYVTLSDLHSLSSELGLAEELVDEAFRRLDTKNVGFLTLDEFKYGFGCFLGVEEIDSNESNECILDEESYAKAQELFEICDRDNKGYVTKYDLNTLTSELGLSDKQISDIFSQLDEDGNGFITLNEFVQGFSSMVEKRKSKDGLLDDIYFIDSHKILNNDRGIDTLKAPSEINSKLTDNIFTQRQPSVQYESGTNGIDEMLNSLEEHVGSSISKEQMLKLWSSVSSSGDMMATKMFETFLLKVHNEIKTAKKEAKYLEDVLEKKSVDHSEEIKRIYDEMETQIQTEKLKLTLKETRRESLIREDLQRELMEKEKHIEKCMQRQIALEKRLQEVKDKEIYLKHQNCQLLKENNELEDKLNDSLTSLEALRTNLFHLEEQTSQEKKETLRAALQATQGMNFEHEDLIRRLDALRKMNQKLRDDRDAIEATLKTNVALPTLEDSSDFDHVKKKRTKYVESILGKNRFSRTASTPSHSPLTKQGSLMSKYFGSQTDLFNQDIERSPGLERRAFSDSSEILDSEERNFIGETEEADLEMENVDCAELCNTVQSPIVSTPQSPRMPPVGRNSEDDNEISIVSLKNPPENPNRVYKIVFVGDSGVGKSSFIYRFCHNDFRPNFSATIGVDFQVKTLEVCNNWIALQLWDTAGQERFHSLTKQYFRRADGIVIMFDLTSESSFTNVKGWMLNVEDGAESDCIITLIGNKVDKIEGENSHQRKIKKEVAEKIAEDFHALYFEVSARSGENVNEAISSLAKKLKENEDSLLQSSILNLNKTHPPDIEKTKKRCCR